MTLGRLAVPLLGTPPISQRNPLFSFSPILESARSRGGNCGTALANFNLFENQGGATGAMSQLVIGPGICDTCADREHCTHRAGRTITQCFEFKPNGKPPAVPPTRVFLPRDNTKISNEMTRNDAEQLKGLCPTCSHFHHCTFPQPSGGVWHCEHYN